MRQETGASPMSEATKLIPGCLPLRLKSQPDVVIAKVYGKPHPDGGDYAPIFETSDKPLAEYFVKAVNNHQKLVEALEAMVAFAERVHVEHQDELWLGSEYNEAVSVLSAVEEQK